MLEETSVELLDNTRMIQMNLEAMAQSCLASGHLDANSTRVLDSRLLLKLKHSLTHLDLDDIFGEDLQASASQETLNKSEKSQTNEGALENGESFKFRNSNVVNTRTGLKYKAPMRGGHTNTGQRHTNGQAMTASNGSNQMQGRSDSFRARLPNTSRPPSLHVDEFLRLENSAKQQQSLAGSVNPSVNNNLVSIDLTSGTDLNNSITGTDLANKASEPAEQANGADGSVASETTPFMSQINLSVPPPGVEANASNNGEGMDMVRNGFVPAVGLSPSPTQFPGNEQSMPIILNQMDTNSDQMNRKKYYGSNGATNNNNSGGNASFSNNNNNNSSLLGSRERSLSTGNLSEQTFHMNQMLPPILPQPPTGMNTSPMQQNLKNFNRM